MVGEEEDDEGKGREEIETLGKARIPSLCRQPNPCVQVPDHRCSTEDFMARQGQRQAPSSRTEEVPM